MNTAEFQAVGDQRLQAIVTDAQCAAMRGAIRETLQPIPPMEQLFMFHRIIAAIEHPNILCAIQAMIRRDIADQARKAEGREP